MSEKKTVAVIKPESQVLLVQVESKLMDDADARQLHEQVMAAADAQPGKGVILDLTKMQFLPSLILGALVRLATSLKGRGHRLVLAGVREPVRQVFVTTRLDQILEIHTDMPSAMSAATSVP